MEYNVNQEIGFISVVELPAVALLINICDGTLYSLFVRIEK